MAQPRLAFDKTGTSPDNYVPSEPHTLTLGGQRVITLNEGGFYTASIKILRASDGRIMTKGTEYSFVGLDADITAITGKEVAHGILFEDQSFDGGCLTDYQAVGGYEGRGGTFYRELAEAIEQAGLGSLTWDRLNHPETFPPEEHTHPVQTLTELQLLTMAFNEMRNKFVMSHTLGTTANQLDNRVKRLTSLIAGIRDEINSINATGGIEVDTTEIETHVEGLMGMIVDMMSRQMTMETTVGELQDVLVRLMEQLGSIMEDSANQIDVE